MVSVDVSTSLQQQLFDELDKNILPFWMTHANDEEFEGFFGAVSNDLIPHNEVPRSAILYARILWTFSAAYRKLGEEKYLVAAQQAFISLIRLFWDEKYGGMYWSVDKHGRPVSDRKHHYAQAFAIYSLSEYYRAAKDPQSLVFALELFQLLEVYAYDPEFGGYTEGSTREWQPLKDQRLSERDLNSQKSMNTMLHLLEAFTNLRRIWPDYLVKTRHIETLENFIDHIYNPDSKHLKLFFDNAWNSLSNEISFGHDIEASWLMCEAAEEIGNQKLIDQTQEIAVDMAKAVLKEGMSPDGFLYYEKASNGLLAKDTISWWPQVEGMVGFHNVYQITGNPAFSEAILNLWSFIQSNFIDQEQGGWFKQILSDGTPDNRIHKIGPWEGPYHNSRACFELLERLVQCPIQKRSIAKY